jgi:DNA-binding NtrC family response regulator
MRQSAEASAGSTLDTKVPPVAARVLWVGGGGTIPRPSVESLLTQLGLRHQWASSPAQALAAIGPAGDVVCLLDCTRAGDALRMARAMRADWPRLIMIGVVDPARADSTLDAFRAGVLDVLPWPIEPDDLAAVISNARDLIALARDESKVPAPEVSPYGVFGTSPAMRKITELLPRLAPSRCPVLLYGERGTGREMLARAIHGHGRRPEHTFVSVDCSGGTPQELEHDLFGWVPQRRNEAPDERRTADRITADSKLFKAIDGSLFLMNLPELPARLQTRLLRVLRDREVVTTPGAPPIELDVRPIAAVEPGFEAAIDEGRLRRDLYERLALIRIELPPLRQRREDIPFLAAYFVKEICRQSGVPVKSLTRSALTLLAALPWRGNAPELRALLERLVLLTPHGSIRLEDVLGQVRLDGSEVATSGGTTLRDARLRFERDYIATVVRQHHGRMGEAAAALGIQRTNLYRKLRQLSVLRSSR